MLVALAKLELFSTGTLTHVRNNKFKDHSAHATNNTTKLATDVTIAQLVNSLETQIFNRTVVAKLTTKTAK
jgi:hypothetical protein